MYLNKNDATKLMLASHIKSLSHSDIVPYQLASRIGLYPSFYQHMGYYFIMIYALSLDSMDFLYLVAKNRFMHEFSSSF